MRRTAWVELRRTLIATGLVVLIVWPMYLVSIGGMMSEAEIYHQPPYLIPPNPTMAYYAEAWGAMRPYLVNSIVVALGVTLVTLLFSTPAAFGLARLQVKGGTSISFMMALAQMLPAASAVVPLFLTFYRLGLINTRTGVVLAISAFTIPFGVIVLTAFMRSIPLALIEAARIDGASLPRLFWSIVLPLARPAIATAAMFAFLFGWSDFIFSVSFLQRRELQPMSVGLYSFVDQYGVRWNALMAGSALYALPPVLAVLTGGRALVAGLTSGALKE